MRRPATLRDLLVGVVRAVGVVQVTALGTVAVLALVKAGVYGKSARFEVFPTWLLAADLVLSVVAVAYVVALYRRGGLDTYRVRR